MSVPKRIVGPGLLTASSVVKYTVPVGLRAEITHVHCINTSTSVLAKLFLSMGVDSAGTRFHSGLDIPANGEFDDPGPYTLEAGETLEAHSDQASLLNLWIDARLYAL